MTIKKIIMLGMYLIGLVWVMTILGGGWAFFVQKTALEVVWVLLK